MSVKNKIKNETVETIIDVIDEKLVEYMYEYGNYSDSNDKFYNDKEELFSKVIEEINNRLKNK